VVPTLGDYSTNLVVNASGVVVAGTTTQALNQLGTPFRGTFYVDPLFSGVHLGSASNPFASVTAAFAFAVAQGLTSGIIFMAPGANSTENPVFPNGGTWEIACVDDGLDGGATITGNVDVSTVLFAERFFRSITISGNISGTVVASSSYCVLLGSEVTGNVSLTTTGTAHWDFLAQANVPPRNNASGGGVAGTTSVVGSCDATGFAFIGLVTLSLGSTFNYCTTNSGITSTSATPITLRFFDCDWAGGKTYTAGAGALTLQLDGVSGTLLFAQGMITVGTVITQTLQAQLPVVTTIVNNVGTTALNFSRAPAGLYAATSSLELLAAGTAGTAQVNVTYTDMTGTLQTKAVGGGLLVTGALGTEVTGQLIFHHNGATAISYSVTGVVTPGPLSISLAVAVARRD
jgi:hypothetical protein